MLGREERKKRDVARKQAVSTGVRWVVISRRSSRGRVCSVCFGNPLALMMVLSTDGGHALILLAVKCLEIMLMRPRSLEGLCMAEDSGRGDFCVAVTLSSMPT